MIRKRIVKQVALWALIIAVVILGFFGIQRLRMLSNLTTQLMSSVGYEDTTAKLLAENIEAYMEDGETGVLLAYTGAGTLSEKWTDLGSISFTYALNIKNYTLQSNLKYKDRTIKLDTQGDLQQCIESAGNISAGFLNLENALYDFIESGKTPLNTPAVQSYLANVTSQLKQLDDIQQKYDFTAVPPGSKENVILHLSMYKELYDFSKTFKESLTYSA